MRLPPVAAGASRRRTSVLKGVACPSLRRRPVIEGGETVDRRAEHGADNVTTARRPLEKSMSGRQEGGQGEAPGV